MSRRRNRSKVKRNARKVEKKGQVEKPAETTEASQIIEFEGVKYYFTRLPFGILNNGECECDDCETELQEPPCKGCGIGRHLR